jgi:MFS family permease
MKNVKGLRWWIITLIGVATIINYIDRTSLAVMWPDISKELNLTKDDYASIVSAFMIAYAVGLVRELDFFLRYLCGRQHVRCMDWHGVYFLFRCSVQFSE